jgi:hypothetical protein
MAEGHGLHVEFYIDALQNGFKTEEAGRPIFEDREFVRILIPGDNKTIIERHASDEDKQRFALEYARFKNGMKELDQMGGTPLSQWPAISRSMLKEFAYFNIHTVEQLAGLSDIGKQSFGMGASEWSAKAKAYLETAGNSAAVEKYAAENETLRRDMDLLRQQIAEISARTEKRGPGRPPKASNPVHDLVELD